MPWTRSSSCSSSFLLPKSFNANLVSHTSVKKLLTSLRNLVLPPHVCTLRDVRKAGNLGSGNADGSLSLEVGSKMISGSGVEGPAVVWILLCLLEPTCRSPVRPESLADVTLSEFIQQCAGEHAVFQRQPSKAARGAPWLRVIDQSRCSG